MPQLILPIIMAATAAAGTAHSIYSSMQGPDTPPGQSPADITGKAVALESSNRGTAVKQAAQFLPGIEANSPGVSPDYLKDVSSTFSGNANLAQSPEMQQMIAKFLGIDPGASFGGSGSFGSSGSSPLTPGLTG
jgi:hypothetical protein